MNDAPGLLHDIEGRYFRAVNRLVEPLVRAGWGSPGLLPTGLIVLETEGRRSGRMHRTPVVASFVAAHLLVSTMRGRQSDWVKNLRATGDVRFWLCGRAHSGRAIVFMPDREPPSLERIPGALRFLHSSLSRLTAVGWGFALIAPARD